MRVRVYHRHAVNRSSVTLAALILANFAFMLFFALPVVLAFPWRRVLTATQQAWVATLISIWALSEFSRLYTGHTGNNRQHVPALIRFAFITLILQLPLVILYRVLWPDLNALNEAGRMNRTAALRELFDKNTPYISGCEAFVAIGALRVHPFNRALVVAAAAADVALRTSRARIRTTVRAMEDCTPVMAELESALLLQEAELLSVSNTTKDLLTSIREAQEQLEKKKGGWDTIHFLTTETTKLSSSVKPSVQFLQHLEAALEIIEGTVGRSRLRLALCKEELVLYKQEMFTFARVGVLSCSDPAGSSKSNREHSSTEDDDISGRGNNAIGLLYPKPIKANAGSAAAVVSVVDRVIKGAAKTVTSAPLPGGTRVLSLIRAGSSGIALFHKSSSLEASPPKFMYTAEEEERLTKANLLLQEQQQVASAEDAKAVEASVRELSQLTSLMNEQVMQQNEQFSILLKNTEVAQSNIKKGVGEVGKALTHFWNSTRQLIACLWLSTLILLIANWVIR